MPGAKLCSFDHFPVCQSAGHNKGAGVCAHKLNGWSKTRKTRKTRLAAAGGVLRGGGKDSWDEYKQPIMLLEMLLTYGIISDIRKQCNKNASSVIHSLVEYSLQTPSEHNSALNLKVVGPQAPVRCNITPCRRGQLRTKNRDKQTVRK